MQPLISVIVPVYNVEKYLDRCITSLVEQTYENLEIIMVNDGSSDASGSLCDEWATKDSRIKVLHKINSGPSETRNLGVDQAQGEYISFVDSDDYVSEVYIETLYKNLTESNADISCCSYKTVDVDENVDVFSQERSTCRIITGKSACIEMFESKKEVYYCVLWGKLFKPSIIREIPLPAGRVHEDEATTFKYLYSAPTISVSEDVLYAYYQNKKSIMHVRTENRRPDALWAKMERIDFFEEKQEKQMLSKSLDQVIDFYISRAIIDQKRFSKEAKLFALKYWTRGITKNARCRFLIYFISPSLYEFYSSEDKIGYFKSKVFSILKKLDIK